MFSNKSQNRIQNGSLSKTSQKNFRVAEDSSEDQLVKEVGDKMIDTFGFD